MASPPNVCNFLCGDEVGTLCSIFCNSRKDCPLTPDILYTFVKGIADNSHLFVRGVGNIAKQRAKGLVFRLALYQQLPWLISFVLIISILIYADIIGVFTGIFLIIVAFIVVGIFVYLSYYDTDRTLSLAAPEIISTLNADYNKAKTQISNAITPQIIEAVAAARNATC